MFDRAKIVKDLASDNPDLVLCDTALRFKGHPVPEIMKLDNKVIAGSDPFPLENEEQRTGTYGFISRSELGFKEAILEGELETVGSRLSALEVTKKLFELKKNKIKKNFSNKTISLSQ